MEIGRTFMHDKMQRVAGLGLPIVITRQEAAPLYFEIRINYSPVMSSMDFPLSHIARL